MHDFADLAIENRDRRWGDADAGEAPLSWCGDECDAGASRRIAGCDDNELADYRITASASVQRMSTSAIVAALSASLPAKARFPLFIASSA